MIRTIVFDMDGTLVDTEALAARVVAGFLAEWGIAVTPEDTSFIAGRKWEVGIGHLCRRYRMPHSLEGTLAIFLEDFRLKRSQDLPIVPGSIEAVRALAAEFPLGLVSGSQRLDVMWTLERLGISGCFQTVLGAEDYAASKPDPAGFSLALRRMSADAATTLVFEDSAAGIQSARAAGTWVAAVTSTNHFGHDQSAAHVHIPDFTAIDGNWIRKLKLR